MSAGATFNQDGLPGEEQLTKSRRKIVESIVSTMQYLIWGINELLPNVCDHVQVELTGLYPRSACVKVVSLHVLWGKLHSCV